MANCMLNIEYPATSDLISLFDAERTFLLSTEIFVRDIVDWITVIDVTSDQSDNYNSV